MYTIKYLILSKRMEPNYSNSIELQIQYIREYLWKCRVTESNIILKNFGLFGIN